MKKILSIFALSFLQSSLSLAQGIGDISIEPKNPTLNQPFKITINSNADTPACGLQINLGDGNTRDIRVEKFPVVVDHTYAKEGNFAIAVNGKMIMRGLSSLFPCGGETKTLAVGIGTQNTNNNSAQVAPTPNANPVAQLGNVLQGLTKEADKLNQPQAQTQQQSKGGQQPVSATCDKFKIITAAHFVKHGESVTYLDGKVINSSNYGLTALNYLSSQTVDKPDAIVNRLANDTKFRDAALNDQFPFRRQFDTAWKDFPRVYQWFIAAKAGGSCPWGLSDADLNLVINWMAMKITTPVNQEILISGSIFNKIATNDKGIEKTYKSESENQQKAKFDASPQGKIDSLKDKYVSMMAVNDCHELRKNYVVKYLDNGVYENARAAMKTFENNIKKEVPGINTDRIWQDAVTQYKSSLVGTSLEANKINPQNMPKDNKGLCLVFANDLVNSAPKESPKKNF